MLIIFLCCLKASRFHCITTSLISRVALLFLCCFCVFFPLLRWMQQTLYVCTTAARAGVLYSHLWHTSHVISKFKLYFRGTQFKHWHKPSKPPIIKWALATKLRCWDTWQDWFPWTWICHLLKLSGEYKLEGNLNEYWNLHVQSSVPRCTLWHQNYVRWP